jgi:hypothetical protein
VDKAAAGEILHQVLAPLRAMSYEDLVERFVGRSAEQMTLPNPSGEPYQIEVLGFWDERRSGNLRVHAAIDDGSGWSAFIPLCDDFIKAPDGSFVGE